MTTRLMRFVVTLFSIAAVPFCAASVVKLRVTPSATAKLTKRLPKVASITLPEKKESGVATVPLKESKLTADEAKDAIVRFIRAHRKTFIGDPDPDKMAELPMKLKGEGLYELGAFEIDLAKRTYSAAIGVNGPEPYFYSGDFTRQDDAWIASDPKVQRVHRLLPRKP